MWASSPEQCSQHSTNDINCLTWLLHELNGGAVGIADVNNAFSGVRSHFESLWFARGFPTRRGDSVKRSVKIIYDERDVNVSDIARTNVCMFPIRRREIL